MTPRECRTEACTRAPRPDSPYCAHCFDRLVYGRPGPSYGRIGVRPLPEITELELRVLDGNR